MVAAFSGQLAVLRRLLDAKADVNAVGGHGMPVLSYAAGYGHRQGLACEGGTFMSRR